MKFGAPLAAAAALVGTGVVIYKTATGKKRTPAAREEWEAFQAQSVAEVEKTAHHIQ